MKIRTLYTFAVAALGLLHVARAAPAADTKSPNVVFLISDDQRWTDYGFTGHPHIDTPALDRFARQSVTFTRGYVPDSLCRPSLVTMITGLYPHQHGVVGNDPPVARNIRNQARRDPNHPEHDKFQKMLSLIDAHPTLSGILNERGYLSLQTGKWWEGDPRKNGFTHAMTHGDRTRGGRHGDAGLTIGRQGIGPIVEFLDEAQKQNKPFFIWYAPFLPHEPHNPPKRLLDKYLNKTAYKQQAEYWAMCEWFDETCGQVLAELDQRGLAENTIVVYVCDNGWNEPMGPYEAVGGGAGGSRAKRSQYDGGVRTPIMVRFPASDRATPRFDQTHLASSIDLVPTVLAALNIDAPAGLPGIDLLDRAAVVKRDTIYGEILEHDVVSLDDPAKSLMWRWVIEGRWKLIVPYAERMPDSPVELYDLYADPFELRNLAERHPDRVNALREKLDAWWKP